jgi:amino acid transporter
MGAFLPVRRVYSPEGSGYGRALARLVTERPSALPEHRSRIVPGGRLHRTLGFFGTLSLSVGVMAPTLAMSLTGVGPAGLIGRAAPLAFAMAAIVVALVAYGFVRLSSRFAHAGSVYAFVGNALGPRAGFVAGWAMMGTYLVFPAVSIAAFAIFGVAFLKTAGIASSPAWLPIALAGWAIVLLLASRDVRITTRALLTFELAAVVLILALVVVIFAKLAFGGAPHGLGLTSDFVKLPPGTSFSTVALAATAGFLSFAGFEAAGSFGEEANGPTHSIPRSMVVAIAFGAVFYLICMIAQTLGFGTDAAGVKAFATSGAPLGDLAKGYVGSGLACVLDLGAMISALGAGVGCASVGGRMLFALSRDGVFDRRLSGVSESTGAPAVALAIVLGLDLIGLVAFGAAGTQPIKVFFYFATIGVLSLLAMYIITNLAALSFLWRDERRWYDIVLPLLGAGAAGYTIYRNVYPAPASPFDVFPWIVLGWLVLGAAASWLVPGFAERVREQLQVRTSRSPAPTR